MSKRKDSATAGLQDELAHFLEDILDLAKTKTGIDQDKLDELKQGFHDRIDQLGEDAGGAVRDAARSLSGHAEEAFDHVDSYAREKPWQLVLAAGLLGLAVGVLVARK
jgi:ElaB protein